MTDMKLADMKLTDQASRHEIDGHEIGGQDILYRLKIDYIKMQCTILFKTTAEYRPTSHSSEVSCIDLL